MEFFDKIRLLQIVGDPFDFDNWATRKPSSSSSLPTEAISSTTQKRKLQELKVDPVIASNHETTQCNDNEGDDDVGFVR